MTTITAPIPACIRALSADIQPLDVHDQAPAWLQVIVDTEEEFDWDAPFSRQAVAVTHVQEMPRIEEIFSRHQITPCYVIDYPIAADPIASQYFAKLAQTKRAEIGAHLQPWVNPPYTESLSRFHSFPGNLPHAVERDKLIHLTDTIHATIGVRPRVYKAGRYGLGSHSLSLLQSLGFCVDLSLMPTHEWRSQGGPDYSALGNTIWYIPKSPAGVGDDMLAFPTTGGFIGALSKHGTSLMMLVESHWGQRLRLKPVLDRLGLYTRVRLSPEGFRLHHLQALTRTLYAQGCRVFSLNFHSPSIAVGHTDYSRTVEARDALLSVIDGYIGWFTEHYGANFATPMELYTKFLNKAGVE